MLTRQEAFLQNSPDLFFVLDEAGVVTYQSHSSADILGYEVPDFRDQAPLEYVHTADRERVEADFERLLAEPDEPVTSEFRFCTPSGEYRWYENRAVNRLDDPEVAGILVVNRDVTERKRRERQLQRRNDRLAEFASIVSHDLRNPLQVARGRLELAHDPGTDADLDAVADAHRRMDRLIEDLLTLAHEGDAIAGTEAVSLAELVEECWESVSTAGARLVVDTDRVVEADRSRLRQLFENLFRNAVDHAGEDVTVTVGDLSAGFFVADDGPGIPLEEHERVFDAGYSTEPDGSGLGLRIVEQVAHAHGWTVSVTGDDEDLTSREPHGPASDSSPRPGARFEFTGVAHVDR
jgi:PAS domain S-box-containing protein